MNKYQQLVTLIPYLLIAALLIGIGKHFIVKLFKNLRVEYTEGRGTVTSMNTGTETVRATPNSGYDTLNLNEVMVDVHQHIVEIEIAGVGKKELYVSKQEYDSLSLGQTVSVKYGVRKKSRKLVKVNFI